MVGKGTYALGEWGYYPGTVKDVIYQILRSHGAPLSQKQIIDQVKSQRVVKKNTILLNLMDKTFVKNEYNHYLIREV